LTERAEKKRNKRRWKILEPPGPCGQTKETYSANCWQCCLGTLHFDICSWNSRSKGFKKRASERSAESFVVSKEG
jgi:hypothetical protein